MFFVSTSARATAAALVRCTIFLVVCVAVQPSTRARGQDANVTGQSAAALSTPTPSRPRDASGTADALTESQLAAHRDPMPWLSLSLRIGVAQVHAGNINNPAYRSAIAAQAAQLPPETIQKTGYVGGGACTILDPKCRTDGRFGVHVVAALHFGGDGFGWDLEPYFTHGSTTNTVGMYSGPKFDLHITDPAYIGFGFGVRAAYVHADGWLYGADVGARVPFHGLVYVTDDVAVELDFGIGIGASGYMNRNVVVTNPVNGVALGSAPRMTFGLARAWDLTLGVRFP